MRKFVPKTADHPSIGEPCPVCDVPFKEGDYTTLIVLDTDKNRQRRDGASGGYYNAVATEIHYDCAP